MADLSRSGEIVVSDLPGDRWVVTLKGEHDLSTADEINSLVEAIFAKATSLVVDLRETSFIDSTILRVLLEADKSADSSACEHFALVVAHDSHVTRLFDLVGAGRVFQMFGSVEEAFAHFDASDGMTTDGIERWMTRKQRIVKNEKEFRGYNNRRLKIEPVGADDDEEMVPFLCECGDRDCIKALLITPAEFTEAHSAPNLFIVKPGHVYPDIERVVSEHDHFAIVQKTDMHPARETTTSAA